MVKNIILLGGTGSIGTQVLELIKDDVNYNLYGFSFGDNIEKAKEIIDEFKPKLVCCKNVRDKISLSEIYNDIKFVSGDAGLQQLASYVVDNKIFINALVGAVGLVPTMAAIENGNDVLLANKETLVIAGELICDKARQKNVKIIPIDSEHSAIFQLINDTNKKDIKNLIVTASGGSFRDLKKEELINVTKEEALNHPNWKMGSKITIDSATMMNKGFELIEAYHLFNIDIDNIKPIIHRESIIHSMVEFNDGVIFAQMGVSDMRVPIKYALEYPNHTSHSLFETLDLAKVKTLNFEEVSFDRYPLVKCAIDCIKQGKLQPTILNAANEAAVKLFLEDKIKFVDIEKIIIDTLNNPKYQVFNNGDINISKILMVHEMVFNDIYYNN